jgi:hypothetical protein
MARFCRQEGLGPLAAMVPGYLFVALVYWPLPFYYHHVLALPLLLATVALALDGRRWAWFGGGVAAALTFFTTQTDGFLAMGLLACGVWLARRGAGMALAGLAAGGALVLGWFAWHGALGEAYRQAWLWPLVNYKHAGNFNDVAWLTDVAERLTPYTASWINMRYYYATFWLVCAPHVAIIGSMALAVGWFLGGWWQRAWRLQPRLALLLLTALGSGLVCTVGRADYSHTRAYAGPALLVAWLFAWKAGRTGTTPGRWTAAGVLLASLVPAAFVFGTTMRLDPHDWLSWRTPDARYMEQPAIQYLLAHSSPGEPIISLIHGGQFYRSVRPSATRYPLMTPPDYHYHTDADRKVVLDEIASKRARYVIIASRMAPDRAPTYHLGQPLVGYHYEATRDLMFHGKPLPQLFYRRDD